jgi:hypothetical protein
MRIFAIDPGYERSALVVLEWGITITRHEVAENDSLLCGLRREGYSSIDWLVVEQIASFGMPVGAEVFETVFWSGRFAEAWHGHFERVKRHAVKTHLCGNQRAKDAHIRQALLDRFGPGKEKAVGTKKAPGPLYGLVGDEWSALAVAVTFWDALTAQRASQLKHGSGRPDRPEGRPE